MMSAMQSIPEVVQFLIDRGADVGFVDKSGRTAKAYALSLGNKEVVKVLEQAGG
jgi:ankyrin repeat protein